MIKNTFLRKWHRDLGYFFIGLLVTFAVSGIAQNHRRSWDPEEYVYTTSEFQTLFNSLKTAAINDDLVKKLMVENGITGPLRGFRLTDDSKGLKIFFESGYLFVDLTSGRAKLELMKTRPIIGFLSKLHKSSNGFWIWYSDLFAVGLITTALLGCFLVKGKYSFRHRGFKLMLAGMLAPLFTLLFLVL